MGTNKKLCCNDLLARRYKLQPVMDSIYIAEGQNLKFGSVVDCNGFLCGSTHLEPYAILYEDCDTTNGAQEANVLIMGEFNIEKLVFGADATGDILDKIVFYAKKNGIIIRPYDYAPSFTPPEVSIIENVIPEGTSKTNPLINAEEAQRMIDASIHEVTLDPSEVALGNVHLLDEVTSFAADAKILVDSETNGPGAMSADNLLKLTAQNALAGNVVQAFDPERTSENPYKAGESVVYEGKTYVFKVDHYGAWDASDVYSGVLADNIELLSKQSGIIIEDIDALVHSMPEELKEAGYRKVLNVRWEQGTINGSGEEVSSDYAIRSGFIDITVPSYLDNKSSGSTAAWVRGYAADKSFIGNFQYDNGKMKQYESTSSLTDSYNLDFSLYPSVKYIRIVERHNPSDGTTISPDGNKIDVERIVSVPNGVNLSEIIGPINAKADDIIERLPSVMKDENVVEQEIVWGQGTISSNTGVDESSNYRIRTDFIDVSKKLYLKNEDGNVSVTMRGYAADKSFIDNFSFVDGEIEKQGGTWSASSYYLDFGSFPSVKYVRIIQKYVTDGTTIEPSDNEIEIDGFFETLNDVTFDDILEEAGKKPYSSNDISFVYDVPGGYYTKGFLKLPSNYVQAGKKVPLIVFVHGSGDISSINATSMTSGYNTYYNYLRDCGYAIFDCYPYSSKYSSQAGSSSNTWGLPINKSCYKAGIEYVLKNYNVDGSRIFVSCKSLGGLQAMSMFYDETIPVAAVGMLAPEIDQLNVYMGYSSASKKIAAQDLDFSEDVNDVLDFNQGDSVPAGFWDYITANMQKWVGKFAVWCGLDIPNADKPDYYQLIRNTSEKPRKSLNRPVKIWMASDDNSVDYRNIVAFVSSLNNGGYIGELRTMPDGTGGHHSVDSDPSALQTTNVTTPLGVFYETIPTAYYELELWFRKWL